MAEDLTKTGFLADSGGNVEHILLVTATPDIFHGTPEQFINEWLSSN